MSDKNFVREYLNDFSALIKPDDQIVKKIIEVKDLLVQAKKNRTKITFIAHSVRKK